MMIKSYIIYSFVALALILLPRAGLGDVSLPWTTTYDCPEWEFPGGFTCDNIVDYGGGWTCDTAGASKNEQITLAANNPDGDGGRGQRHWEGDGSNDNSGGLRIDFVQQTELWLRWYMRYQSGFQWSTLIYDKWLYFNVGQPHAVVPEWQGSDRVGVWAAASDNNNSSVGNDGWTSTMGGATSDGQWHYYEVHLKMDTDGTDGETELWVDGVRKLQYADVDFGTTAGWNSVVIGTNQASPANGVCEYVDYDDITISNTGYIGPISDTVKPSPPTNLQKQ